MTYSSSAVCRMCGCSYRQLDLWRRSGWIPGVPERSGYGIPITYTDAQVECIRELATASYIKRMTLLDLAAHLRSGAIALLPEAKAE